MNKYLKINERYFILFFSIATFIILFNNVNFQNFLFSLAHLFEKNNSQEEVITISDMPLPNDFLSDINIEPISLFLTKSLKIQNNSKLNEKLQAWHDIDSILDFSSYEQYDILKNLINNANKLNILYNLGVEQIKNIDDPTAFAKLCIILFKLDLIFNENPNINSKLYKTFKKEFRYFITNEYLSF